MNSIVKSYLCQRRSYTSYLDLSWMPVQLSSTQLKKHEVAEFCFLKRYGFTRNILSNVYWDKYKTKTFGMQLQSYIWWPSIFCFGFCAIIYLLLHLSRSENHTSHFYVVFYVSQWSIFLLWGETNFLGATVDSVNSKLGFVTNFVY